MDPTTRALETSTEKRKAPIETPPVRVIRVLVSSSVSSVTEADALSDISGTVLTERMFIIFLLATL